MINTYLYNGQRTKEITFTCYNELHPFHPFVLLKRLRNECTVSLLLLRGLKFEESY